MALAHGWSLVSAGAYKPLATEWLEPAVAAIPETIATRIGPCQVALVEKLPEPTATSRWTRTEHGITIELAAAGLEPHDVGMELLLCAGQILWELARQGEREGFLKLLAAETEAGVEGEVDEEPLRQKRRLMLSAASARNIHRLERYIRASFAYTVAEYIHCLWHDVTVRSGPEHLPPQWLRRRLEAVERWYPPNPGYSLYPGR